MPSVPTAGNHEYSKLEDGKTRVFSNHWNKIYAMPQNPPTPEYQNRAYSFDYQGVRFISVDSYTFNENNKDLTTIVEWLESTLENNPCKWTVVFNHYPVYTCSSGRNN
ncbi:MAG: metallophosphoesterase [Fermentimonas sp.]|nr:metallophosphoesterase [Fermentimonas sp.]